VPHEAVHTDESKLACRPGLEALPDTSEDNRIAFMATTIANKRNIVPTTATAAIQPALSTTCFAQVMRIFFQERTLAMSIAF